MKYHKSVRETFVLTVVAFCFLLIAAGCGDSGQDGKPESDQPETVENTGKPDRTVAKDPPRKRKTKTDPERNKKTTFSDPAPRQSAEHPAQAARAASAGELFYSSTFSEPDPAPELPDDIDPFAPPTRKITAPKGSGISQWTRTAVPGDHLVLAGWNFRSESDPEGQKTRFEIFGQTSKGKFNATTNVTVLEKFQTIVQISDKAPQNSMYLIFPSSAKGMGKPIAVNHTEAWYTVPKNASSGERVSLVGRNLSHNHGENRAWIYIKPKGKREVGFWAEVRNVNPYKVDFVLPKDLPTGSYEVWAHNGHGGRYGWGPLHSKTGGSLANQHLKVHSPQVWDGPTVNVTDFGADGTDSADDTEAILAALKRTNDARNATLYFPTGTFYLSKTITLTKPTIRIRGDGMKKTFIKGMPGNVPKLMLHIKTEDILIENLALVINQLGEKKKFYRGADRGEHNPKHYEYLEKVNSARDAIKKWKKKHKGQPVPEKMKPPPSPGFPDVKARQKLVASAKKRGGGRMIYKDVWASGLKIRNCVLDAERRNIELLKGGISEGELVNCDIVGREIQLGCPKFARVERCNFFGRADTGVMMYSYGGWCNVISENTGRDYMPNTYDTCMGRFYTVTAYGNRQENVYIGGNRTKDLTVNPVHYNQNSGEQIMWETMPIYSTQKPTNVDGKSLTFEKPFKGKIKWYSDAIIVAGKGMGQYRRIATYEKKTGTVTLVHPWKVMPDENSVIQIGRPIRRVAVYGNHLDGKPRAYSADHHIASAGVEPFGASVELIVENNVFHELKAGIATFSPYMFHHYANNRCHTVRTGISIGNGTGAAIRRNTLQNIRRYGLKMGIKGVLKKSPALDIIENNTGKNVPIVLRLGSRYHKKVSKNRKLLLYRNRFARGNPDSDRSIAIQTSDPDVAIRRENQWAGYAKETAPK